MNHPAALLSISWNEERERRFRLLFSCAITFSLIIDVHREISAFSKIILQRLTQ